MAPIRPRVRAIKKPIRLPANVATFSGTRTAKAASKKSSGKAPAAPEPKIRGAEVSIRSSSADGQLVYGSFKIGGVYTFVETNRNSKAFLTVGSGTAQFGLSALVAGDEGNTISITLVCIGTVGSTTVTVTDKAISVRLKSSSDLSSATATQVVNAINASTAASALVIASLGEGAGAGFVQSQAETFLQYGGGKWLHQIITLAAHEITAVDKLYLDEREVTFESGTDGWATGYFRRKEANGTYTKLVRLKVALGTENQSAIDALIAQLPSSWTANHRQRGCAHAYLTLVWDEKRFPQGLPAVAFQVRGKPVYDPRTSTTAYSTNAALIIADYLTNTKWGLGVDWADIDTNALNDAADVCDETVALLSGQTEKRYTIEGVFDTSQAPGQVLQEMADAIAGDIVYQSGKWRILPGKWREPTVSLTRDDLLGSVTVATRRSRADTFNCVRGTIASKNNNFEPIDFPAIKVPAYVTEDGREIYQDLTLNFVTSLTQAQRIARIRLAQIRQPIVIEATFGIKAMTIQVGDVISYTDATFGWTSKAFEVRTFSLDFAGNIIVVKVTLAETASAIYSWSVANELTVDPAPNTSFPDYSDLSAITGLTLASGTEHLYVRADGTVFARVYVTWTASNNEFVLQGGFYEIQSKLSSTSAWLPNVIVSSETTNVYILDVKDGQQYDVRIRAVTAAGVESEWTTISNYTVIGKTAPPTDVPLLSATIDGFGILLTWQSVLDLDLQEYEIRYGTSGASWASLVNTAIRVKATQFFFKTFTAGTYVFHVKAVDTSGNYSVLSTTASLTIAAPGVVDSYKIEQIDNNVLVDWDEPTTSTFPIDHYNVYKGATFAGATLLGTVGGTFFTYLEKTGGTFTYWVTAVDTAGNEGTAAGKTVLVASPPDYILIDSRSLVPASATLVRCLDEGDGDSFLAPFNITETFEQHFTNNSQTTVQGFIDSGLSLWAQPTPTSAATAEWTYDLGTTLAQNLITVSWVATTIAGSPTVSATISWRALTTDSWTNGTAGANQVFATNFRYVKVVLSITGTNNLALARIGSVVAKIDTKKQSDAGTATVSNATSGATVNFNLNFIDIISINVTPQSTTAVIPVVDFNDVPNPTSFVVYLYNTSGTKVTGSFRWTAVGILNNT